MLLRLLDFGSHLLACFCSISSKLSNREVYRGWMGDLAFSELVFDGDYCGREQIQLSAIFAGPPASPWGYHLASMLRYLLSLVRMAWPMSNGIAPTGLSIHE